MANTKKNSGAGTRLSQLSIDALHVQLDNVRNIISGKVPAPGCNYAATAPCTR
jgi:hypothetical protein